eukprot:1283910-Heterocapsa_arctica.AAC.1
MVTARALPDSFETFVYVCLMIRLTVLAQNVVAHLMVIARPLPDSLLPTQQLPKTMLIEQ